MRSRSARSKTMSAARWRLRFADARSSGWCELPRTRLRVVGRGAQMLAVEIGGQRRDASNNAPQSGLTERPTRTHPHTPTHTHARTSCSRVTTERIERDLGCSSHTQSHGSAASWPSSGARERVKPRRHDPLFFLHFHSPSAFPARLGHFFQSSPPPLCTVSVSHSAPFVGSSLRLTSDAALFRLLSAAMDSSLDPPATTLHSIRGATSSNVAQWIRRRLVLRSSCSRMDDRLI
ncbi:hypothetical protein L1887_55224 [Cichorium endivia]|nr:hypothetical protein L1887_55224 [Cichorium endivia]